MKNILVIDDTTLVRYRITSILKTEGFNVYQSANAASVRQNTFASDISLKDIDLILLDIYLSSENGFDLLSFLGKQYPAIDIIVVSGANRAAVIKRSVSLGAKDFIAKSFDRSTLLRKVNNIDSVSENKGFLKKEESYKTTLSMELNRSIRSKLSFSVVKLDLPHKIDQKYYMDIKDLITSRIRNIDQIFFLQDFEYLFILPLTDREGREVFIEKITNISLENKHLIKDNFEVEAVTFPEEIIDLSKLDPENYGEYKEGILKKVGIERLNI
ncbi:response regulator [Halanaerobium sp. ST460_2HS_T2]|uniref:response regulator n=1 Tax=Halanaerobium sp. ST460_2HS_T2 TaxID=2183914 RepID=UPI000E05C3A1|nr:response regulator [Halanaerobium sp. ST460_2HS_T2]RCW50609.1 response regulator receiver modulated diguanylate cyclase [Halanaerobium sp. ST460_2HS_T2]